MGEPNAAMVYEHPIIHFSHPHPLQLLNLSPDASKLPCAACKLETSGSAYTCNFSLHPKCYQLPRVINHPFHQSHALYLHPKPVYPEGQFRCAACLALGDGFSYHCRTCGTDLHPTCASLPLKLSHQCHNHDLSLALSAPYRWSCDLCRKGWSNSWLYRCNDCGFDVHLTCLAEIIPPDGPVCNYGAAPPSPMEPAAPSFERAGGHAFLGNEEEVLVVRAKATGANVEDIEHDAKIHREEALCVVCYSKCEDDNNIFKTKCRCKFSLIHETCASNWSVMKDYEQKCRLCDQKIELVPVILSKIGPSEKKENNPSEKKENGPSEKKENNPSEKKEDSSSEKKEDGPSEKKEDGPSEKKEDNPSEKKEDDPCESFRKGLFKFLTSCCCWWVRQ